MDNKEEVHLEKKKWRRVWRFLFPQLLKYSNCKVSFAENLVEIYTSIGYKETQVEEMVFDRPYICMQY